VRIEPLPVRLHTVYDNVYDHLTGLQGGVSIYGCTDRAPAPEPESDDSAAARDAAAAGGGGVHSGAPGTYRYFDIRKHLTNTSLHAGTEGYTQNQGVDGDGEGSKWSLQAFWRHIHAVYGSEKLSVLRANIHDLIVKAVLAAELQFRKQNEDATAAAEVAAAAGHVPVSPNTIDERCFEMFGFDVLVRGLDDQLPPSCVCSSWQNFGQTGQTVIHLYLFADSVRCTCCFRWMPTCGRGCSKSTHRLRSNAPRR
jgi:hypothetical protein